MTIVKITMASETLKFRDKEVCLHFCYRKRHAIIHRLISDQPRFGLLDFLRVELNRGYCLDHDEERYTSRREKIYSFMKIPRELEKFLAYGCMQCADSFLYIFTFLPIRYIMAIWALFTRPLIRCLKKRRDSQRILAPAETCDLLKGTMWIIVSYT